MRSNGLSCRHTVIGAIAAATLVALAPRGLAQGPSCQTGGAVAAAFDPVWGGEVREVFALPDPNAPTDPTQSHVWRTEDGGRIRLSLDGGQTWGVAQTPNDVRTTILDIFFLNVDEGWAVGLDGVILHSTDGGFTWSQLPTVYVDPPANTEPAALWGARFQDSDHGFLVGEEVFRKTINAGCDWTDVNLHLDDPPGSPLEDEWYEFYSIDLVQIGDDLLGLASAEAQTHFGGVMFRTTNGDDWTIVRNGLTTVDHAFEGWEVDIEPNPTSTDAAAYFVGGAGSSAGRVFRSKDGGQNWTEEFHPGFTSNPCPPGTLAPCHNQTLSSFPTLYGVATLSSDVAIACSYAGGVFTRDLRSGSPAWHDESYGCTFTGPLDGAGALDDTHAWVVGTFGYAYATSDAGDTFVTQNPNGGLPFRTHDVAFVDNDTGFVVAQPSLIMKTSNGGQSWIIQNSVFCPTLGPNLAAIAASGSTGVAVGGSVYRRDPNTPAEWVLVVPNPASSGLASVSHAGANEYWAVGGNSTVIRSLDGGTSWNPVDASNGFATGLALRGVAMINSSTGFVVGFDSTGAGRAFRVQNAVTAPLWVEVTPTCPATVPRLEDVAVRSAGGVAAFAVGFGGAVFKYNRIQDRLVVVPGVYVPAACATPTMPAAQLTTSDLHAVEMPLGTSDVWIGGDFGTVLRFTSSGGWTLPKSGTSKDVLGISFPSSGRGYIACQTLPNNGSTTAFADGIVIRTP